MTTVLEIGAHADVAAAAADLGGLGGAARDLGSDLDSVNDKAGSTGAGLEGLGEGSDNLASKSSQATGALGALAGGLEAVGLEKYAGGLQAAAIGTDVMSGAGDALNLVAETQAGRWIAATAASVGHKVAMVAGAAVTGAMTIAQGALNAVMALNPIGLVVIAVLALVAGVILAYQHSETFREIVQKVFDAAAGYVGVYIDIIKGVIDIFQDIPEVAREVWEKVSGFIKTATTNATGFVTDLFDGVSGGAESIKNAVSGAFETMFAPILTAVGWVQDLIDKIANIDFPDFPDVPFLKATGGTATTTTTTTPAATTVNITVNGAIDPISTAQQIARILSEAGYALAGVPGWTVPA